MTSRYVLTNPNYRVTACTKNQRYCGRKGLTVMLFFIFTKTVDKKMSCGT